MAENFPTKFGMEPDLRKCEGRTIERAELLVMDHGCTWRHAYAVRFTDGTRAFFAGHIGTGIMDPQVDGTAYGEYRTVETSDIFTKREYAEMMAARERQEAQRKRDTERAERREFERLAAKFATPEQA